MILLGIILMFVGILGGTAIFAYIIIDDKKRKREIERRKKKARLKKRKMQEAKDRVIAKAKVLEDDVKIYVPKKSNGYNIEHLTQAN